MICWFAFALVFLLKRKPAQAPDRMRDTNSWVGIALQGASYAFVWAVRRPSFSPFINGYSLLDEALAVLAIVLTVGSVLIVMWAVRMLGKQWSLTARVLEGHRLITEGPYAWVRHPIYTGMLGMMLATGLVYSHWLGLVLGLSVFAVGTIVRVRSEERLLREAFGAEYEEYARRVAAVVPGLF